MFFDRLIGDRFFARVRGFELACPRCGELSIIGEGKKDSKRVFDRSKSIWHCRYCSLHLAIGIVAWPVRNGPTGMPEDQVPTYREAMKLRELFGLLGIVPEPFREEPDGSVTDQRHGAKEPVNVVIKGECRCRVGGAWGVIRHPRCPVHGQGEER